jgi:hypothetical protein
MKLVRTLATGAPAETLRRLGDQTR